MKKIGISIIAVLLLLGCSKNSSASFAVEKYLNSFINLDKEVKDEINTALKNSEYKNDNEEIYKKILTRQYKDLKYDIYKEEYDGNKALIYVNINVYDLRKAEEESLEYLSEHLEDFYDSNNIFNNDKYISYKLDLMSKTKLRVDYEIIFYLEKSKGNWILSQPTDNDLEKIHGIYHE